MIDAIRGIGLDTANVIAVTGAVGAIFFSLVAAMIRERPFGYVSTLSPKRATALRWAVLLACGVFLLVMAAGVALRFWVVYRQSVGG